GSTHRLEYDSEPVLYSKSTPQDAISRLQKQLKDDPAKGWLPFDPKFGYLPALLERLQVPVSSQMLVFSKTSLQRQQIRPDNARALFFSDDVYIGFIPGASVLEVAAVDPQLGAVFYTVNQDKDEPVRFRRDTDCLSCHGAARSMGVPGFVVRSLSTEPNGEPVSGTETDNVTHFTPLAERWGGWYVTGAPADWTHRGNRPGEESGEGDASIRKHLEWSKYPAQSSHVLPLLVHDHQTHMHNYLTRLSMEGRESFAMYGHVRYLRHQIDALLRYLLFAEEASLPSPIPPEPAFMEAFLKGARRDRKGRSLRDFDLQTRLFKYPCSFLIESEAFEKLPPPVREQILAKLWDILSSPEPTPGFASLTPESRREILEILRETLPFLPDSWKSDAKLPDSAPSSNP
ncbi:MAG: hypothetical protein RLZZ142_2228, partial [Verrucomicrobiota bacterium]